MPEGSERPGFSAAMRLERDHLFDSGHFAKAPTLMRLLAFLVEETLAGRGDQLKSYSVAVDGLGRDADFDAQADSYPRVQVVRLRKLLEAFYARHDPSEHSCIFLISGSYRVRLAPLSAAYPELVRAYPIDATNISPEPAVKSGVTPLLSKQAGIPEHPVPTEATLEPEPIDARSSYGRNWGLIGAALLVISAVLIAYTFSSSVPEKTPNVTLTQIEAPVLVLDPVNSAADNASTAIADDVYALLADGIGRSWLVRLRLSIEPLPTSQSATPAYRLTVQLGKDNGDGRPVYLRLTEYDTSNLLWSTTVNLNSGRPIGDRLGQAIAQLTGPFGVVAAREYRIAQGQFDSGYSCLLGYLGNIAKNSSKVDEALGKCLTQENADAKLDAVRLAFQSFHAIEGYGEGLERRDRIARAMNLARQSIDTDPKEAYAHFAMARIQFVTGNCPSGKQHSAHAVDANPFDPVILAVLGNFTAMCGYNEGLAMLDKAFAYRSPGESHARLSLILASIWQKRFDHLKSLREDGEQAIGTSPAYHYLCETLIAAALDDTIVARANWQKFRASPHKSSASDDAMLATVIMSPDIRARILAFLKQKDVVSPPTP
jgi:tetratricopeptide (TPR) repeat protein